MLSGISIKMEFPDIVLALIHEFSRPRVNKEALKEYVKVVRRVRNMDPSLKRKMVRPEAVAVVREFNRVSDLIQCLQIERNEVRTVQLTSAIDRLLLAAFLERDVATRNLRGLVAGEGFIFRRFII